MVPLVVAAMSIRFVAVDGEVVTVGCASCGGTMGIPEVLAHPRCLVNVQCSICHAKLFAATELLAAELGGL